MKLSWAHSQSTIGACTPNQTWIKETWKTQFLISHYAPFPNIEKKLEHYRVRLPIIFIVPEIASHQIDESRFLIFTEQKKHHNKPTPNTSQIYGNWQLKCVNRNTNKKEKSKTWSGWGWRHQIWAWRSSRHRQTFSRIDDHEISWRSK